LDNVVRDCAAIRAVDGVSLKACAGEFIALLGPNGGRFIQRRLFSDSLACRRHDAAFDLRNLGMSRQNSLDA
jgi:ABC-type hemin transport system ATPase subunit